MAVVLKIQSPDFQMELPLNPYNTVVIGRGAEANCTVKDAYASNIHCRFVLRADKLEIQDLKSKNGTYLNGIRIDRSDIFIGDVIKIGKTEISLVPNNMEAHHISLLTFPGAMHQRLYYELRADFTSVYQRQFYAPLARALNPNRNTYAVEQRKHASDMLLSKSEIKRQHKIVAGISHLLDTFILILLMAFPFFLIDTLLRIDTSIDPSLRLQLILVSEVIIIGIFCLMNFCLSNFSLGEKIGGIEKIYRQQ